MKKIIALHILLLLFLVSAFGQEKTISDTLLISTVEATSTSETAKKERKNIININVSNPMLISNKFQTIGYEHIFSNNQSFTVNVGIFSLPRFLDGDISDSLGLNYDTKDKGFHLSADYRFYLAKLNKYKAPRGIYIAPYYTFNYLNRQNSWQLEGYVEEVFTNTKFNIHTIGFELGYQFVFWDRVALDLILLGPGQAFYGVKTTIGTTIDPDNESRLFEKINNILEDRIPGYERVIEPGDYIKSGSFKTWNVGYRYVIRLGILF